MRRFKIVSEGLYLGSNPVECGELNRDQVDTDRRVHCRRYTRCVTFAASLAWPGFTCRHCSVTKDRITLEEEQRDLDGLAGVLREINIGGERRSGEKRHYSKAGRY